MSMNGAKASVRPLPWADRPKVTPGDRIRWQAVGPVNAAVDRLELTRRNRRRMMFGDPPYDPEQIRQVLDERDRPIPDA